MSKEYELFDWLLVRGFKSIGGFNLGLERSKSYFRGSFRGLQ